MYILIIGSIKDHQVKSVFDRLNNFGVKVVIFDRYDRAHSITWVSDHKKIKGLINGYPGIEVPFDCVNIVWWRFKSLHLSKTLSSQKLLCSVFTNKEWREVFNSLPFYLKKAVWINDFWAQTKISPKIIQLQIAQEIGFKIPYTVLGNDNQKILSIFEEEYEVIYKTLFSPRVSQEEVILTTKVTREQVIAKKEKIKECPKIFQNFIEKEFELRITIIGDKLFPVKINVDTNSTAYTDWRNAKMQDIYSITVLDNKLELLIRSFHKKVNLVTATYDIIRGKDGEYYFLECNPSGQWLWIEKKLGLPITKELVLLLYRQYKNKIE